jgi:solute carrier family 25 phosphate transporter 23/24/25/41
MGNVYYKPDHSKEEIISLFKDIYSLPRYSDFIKNTSPQSEDRIKRIYELIDLLYDIYDKLDVAHPSIDYLDAHRYNKHINILKNHLLDKITQTYVGIPAFVIVNEINNRSGLTDTTLCEQLMLDLANKLREETMKKEAKEQIKGLFRKYDVNGDGTITMDDLEEAITRLGLPKQVAKEVLSAADSGHDGKISLEEFENYTEEQVIKYYKIFYNLDSDNDMQLNYKQARQSLHEIYPKLVLSDEIYKRLFLAMDEDKTGLINFEEWSQFLLLFPEKNLNYMVDQWRLMAVTTISPQEPDIGIIEKDMKHKKDEPISLHHILKNFICGGIAGGVSRTITAPLENLKVIYQTSYIASKPPSVARGILNIYEEKGFRGLYRGNTISISMSVLEQAMRFAIIDYTKKHLEDEYGSVSPKNLLCIGIMTGILASCILFPLEVVRVRVMTSDDTQHKVYNKIKKIYTQHGIRGFYSGYIPHIMSVLPAGSVNVVFYNFLKKLLVTERDIETLNMNKFMLIGGFAGMITGTITYPLNILTTRTIVANRDRPPTDRISFISIIRRTLINEGFLGFVKGYQASILRLFIGQSFNFGTYETLRGWIRNNDKKKKKI